MKEFIVRFPDDMGEYQALLDAQSAVHRDRHIKDDKYYCGDVLLSKGIVIHAEKDEAYTLTITKNEPGALT